MQNKLEQTIEVLKKMRYMINREMIVELFDDSRTLVFCDAIKMVPKHKIGDRATVEADMMNSVFSSGAPKSGEGTDASGRDVEITYVPVTDNGEVVGCIVTTFAKHVHSGVMEKAETFMDAIDKINNSVDMMSIHFENLFEKLQHVEDRTGSINKSVEDTSAVVAKIRANASKSKILALNASIEAARSGEAGKGFTVVAKEMGEMATTSGTSAVEINDALQSIFEELNEVTASITDAANLAEKQTTSISEIEEALGAAIQAAMELGELLS